MKKTEIYCTETELKAFFRYEMKLKKPITGRCRVTPEDLRAAYANILRADPGTRDLLSGWFGIIDGSSAYIGLQSSPEKERNGAYAVRFLATDDSTFLSARFLELESFFDDADLELNATEYAGWFCEQIEKIDWYIDDRNKPLAERHFAKDEKRSYIWHFENDSITESAEEYELWLCRLFTEELCSEDDIIALRVKGYASYGGNRLYPCDWFASRDCMERLLKLSGEGVYANTLGYIYYYGRCNKGEPEYEKAFEMYTIGAKEGFYESSYKLADMYANGYGCIKNPVTAKLIYLSVYNECKEDFLYGQGSNLADAALRMGRVFLDGIGVEPNPRDALGYLLEARYAQNLRMEKSGFYGIGTVTQNIENAIRKAKEQLGEDYFVPYITDGACRLAEGFVDGNNIAEVSADLCQDGTAALKLQRLAYYGRTGIQLVREPRLELCEWFSALSFIALRPKLSKKLRKGSVRTDRVCWNGMKARLEFFLQGERVAWIAFDELRFYGKEPADGEEYRLATVVFSPYGKSYDYLCSIDNVKAGDRLVVPTQSGNATVTVLRVYTARGSELKLPLERYKWVLEKAEQEPGRE